MEHKGYNITVDGNGKFNAVISEDVTVSTDTLAGCREAIDREIKQHVSAKKLSLSVVGILKGGYRADKTEREPRRFRCMLIGLNRTTGDLKFDTVPAATHSLDDVLPDSPENCALIDQFLKAQSVLSGLRDQINDLEIRRPGYGGRIAPEKYDDKLRIIQNVYAASVKKGKSQ